MANKFIVEYRYTRTDAPWFDLFGQGKWRKWKAYKTLVAANNAIEALRKNKRLPWEKDEPAFQYRHAPNNACSGLAPESAQDDSIGSGASH